MEQNPFIQIGLPIALFIIMMGIGVTLTLENFRHEWRAPRGMIIGTFAQIIIMPILGFAIAALLRLSPELAVGLVIAAACPGGITSNLIAFLARANVALSIILTVVASLITIITLPIAGNLAYAWQAASLGATIYVPIGRTIAMLVVIILIPIAIGMLIRHQLPQYADRIERAISFFGTLVLIALIILILWSVWDQLGQIIATGGISTLLLNVVGLIVGILAGLLVRLNFTDALTCGIELGVKNTTLGMMIALTIIGSEMVAVPPAVYSLAMYITGLVIIGIRAIIKSKAA